MTFRPALAEGIATFLFVFLGAGTVVVTGGLAGEGATPSSARLLAIALAHGLAIALLVAAAGHISGGHINPAVTIGAWVAKKISLMQGIQYIVFQVVGGILAALLLAALLPTATLGDGGIGSHALGKGVAQWQGLLIEMVLTFVLVGVVFSTAMDPKGAATIAPLAIGLTVLVDHLIAVPLTGASMNPARTLGPALASGNWGTEWWIYWVGP
jgi:MIP family channel proteins